MKRLLTASTVLVLMASFAVTGNRTFAARPAAKISLHLCMSFPFGVAAYTELANGMRRGVQLANGQWKGRMARVGINLTPPRAFDDARSDGVDYGTDQERQNALSCLADSHAIGYVGTLNTGASDVSEPILNRAGMVMISPANTGPRLTDPALRAAHEPAFLSGKWKYPSFYRTVTTDSIQGPAGALFLAKILRDKSYFLTDDKQAYGAVLASKMSRYARFKLHLSEVGAGHIDPTSAATIAETSDSVADAVIARHPEAVYFGGNPPEGGPLLRRLRAKGFRGSFIGGDALFNQAFITANGAATLNTYATSVGPDPLKSSAGFRKAYHKIFPGKALGPYDATAYDAASIELNAIYQAKIHGKLTGSIARMRPAILPYVLHTHWMGATGLTTFNKNGDTNNRIVSLYDVINQKKWVFRGQSAITGVPPTP